ncbi:MAG: hypothetical protein Q9227_008191 [Pyrenula ochraceoflavens]
MSLRGFIEGMPKAELHIHLEGALEPLLVRNLAARNKMDVPSSLTERTEGWDFHDLTSFLGIYYPNMTVLQTEEDFCDLAWHYLSKAHNQNVIHTEMFFDPQAHTSRGVPFEVVVRGYRQAIVKAERELSMSASLIMCILRDMDAGFAMATLMSALPYKEWIIGVGLDSDERGNPPAKFAAVFERARKEGFLLTAHCDIDQQNSIEHIRQAVEDIQVDRMDHGTNIVENPGLVETIRCRGIGLTCCPISNSIVTSDFKGKEICSLLRSGVKVTVNSDDPAYFRGYVTQNILKMAEDSNLTKQELTQLQRNAFEISWISATKKDKFLAILDEYARLN